MRTKCIYQRILPGSGALPKDRPAAGQLNLRFHSPVRCGTIHIARLLPPWMNLPPWRLRLHTAQPVIPAADGCAIVPLSIMDDGGEKDFWFPTRSLFCWDFLKMAQTLIAGWKEPIGDYDFSWRLISFILTARFGNFRTLKDGCCFRY